MKYITIILSLILCLMSFSVCGANNDSQINQSDDLQAKQSIGIDSVGNARELGGYTTSDGMKVKHRVLLRTAALNTISSADIEKLTGDYHLAVITDFRMSYEAEPKPDPAIEDVKYVNLRVIDESVFERELEQKLSMEGTTAERMMQIADSGIVSYDMYVNFLSADTGKKAYSEFFHELLNLPEGRSLLFHCTQGKDRTGCAAMLILSSLGVSEDTIMSDYMLTNIYNAELIASQRKMLEGYGIPEANMEKYMLVLDEVSPKTMNTVLSWLKENYGSPVGYIVKELGITEDEIESLKAKFLER